MLPGPARNVLQDLWVPARLATGSGPARFFGNRGAIGSQFSPFSPAGILVSRLPVSDSVPVSRAVSIFVVSFCQNQAAKAFPLVGTLDAIDGLRLQRGRMREEKTEN
jgi:hypothetical protein